MTTNYDIDKEDIPSIYFFYLYVWNSVIVQSIMQVVSRVKDRNMSQVIYANNICKSLGFMYQKGVMFRVEAPMFD